MKTFKYIIRSIAYYYKQHLALFFGVVISATVLAGALIVGDSIRYSLNKMVEFRLGKTQYAVVSGSRFMDSGLAGKISESLHAPAAPVLYLKGIVIKQESGERVNNAGIIGVDSSFNNVTYTPLPIPNEDEVIIGKSLSERLNLNPGDFLLLRVENGNLVPVNAPLAQEPVPTVAFRAKVIAIAGDNQLGRFNLGNDQAVTYNVFVSNKFLGNRLDLSGLSNMLLVTGSSKDFSLDDIQNTIQSQWSLKDMGLSFRSNDNATYDLVSNRIFIDTVIEDAIKKVNLTQQEITTYLVNDIEINGRHTPYSFASAVSEDMQGIQLEPGEVLINEWTAKDLDAKVGDSVRLTYYNIGTLRDLREVNSSYIVRGIINNTSGNINRSLMPSFQGFSEAGSCSEWNSGVPIDLKRIRDKDEEYWDDYRGTPKVILPLETGKDIWKNQFGDLTAIRFNEDEVSREKVTSILLSNVKPSDIGLEVLNVREEGIKAVKNAVDFTELFLGMSFFIILAGILLTVLIYSLHFRRRRPETALLRGLGFSTKKIIHLRIAETVLIVLMGSIAGTFLGLLYNQVLIAGLNTLWNDMVRTDLIMVNIKYTTLVTSILISVLIALLPIYMVTFKRMKKSITEQLKDDVTNFQHKVQAKNKTVFWGYMLLALAVLIVIYSFVIGAYNNAMLYLSSASLVLAGGTTLLYGLLRKPFVSPGHSIPSTRRLAVKNLQRNPARSLSVIVLLAIGTFTVILTGANRKTFYGAENNRSSGTGGYLLWAETTSPVAFNLNSKEGKDRLIFDSIQELDHVRFLQFSRLEGDEASCLNLNQVQRPRLLAIIPQAFDSVKAFTFVNQLPFISEGHPWLGLDKKLNDSTYVAYVDQTVLQYSLQKKLGDTLVYMNEYGQPFRLILAGALNNTIFQGNILISNKVFRDQYPFVGGSKTMLIDAPAEKKATLKDILSNSLIDYGIEITSTGQRLANFYSVTNTYLTVFMALSGLGFILATIGLGIILLRNINERRKELALLLAIGYSRKQIFSIVFAEHLYLLVSGLVTGIVAAIIGIMPSLLSPSFDLEGTFLSILTAGIFVSGLLWIYFPLRSALNKPLIPALQND